MKSWSHSGFSVYVSEAKEPKKQSISELGEGDEETLSDRSVNSPPMRGGDEGKGISIRSS